MAINFSSFFARASSSLPFLLRDTDIRGGLRVVAGIPEMDTIPRPSRVAGMLVVTTNTMHVHQLSVDGIFEDRGLLGQATGTDLKLGDAFYQDADNNLQLYEQFVLPPFVDARPGDLLRLNGNLEPVWLPVAANPGTGVRTLVSNTLDEPIDGGASGTFAIEMGRSNFLLEVRLDVADVLLQGFGTSEYDESNPYTFKSRVGQLLDDGSSLMVDGSIRYGRRYTLISNMESPVGETIYWKMTNHGNLPVLPTVTFTYTAIE